MKTKKKTHKQKIKILKKTLQRKKGKKINKPVAFAKKNDKKVRMYL